MCDGVFEFLSDEGGNISSILGSSKHAKNCFAPRHHQNTKMLAKLLLLISVLPSTFAAEFGLYGVSEDVQLLRVYTNGSSSVISQIGSAGEYGQAQGLSTIDQTNGIFYSILYQLSSSKPFLVGVSLTSGKIVSSVPVPFEDNAFIGVGQWLVYSGPDQIVVGGQDAAQNHLMGTISPTKGNYKQVAKLNASLLDVLGGCHAAYSPATDSVYIQLGTQNPPAINVYEVNIRTGAVRQTNETDTANIDTLSFDPTTKMIYGLGIQVAGSNLQRTIVSLDPSTLRITTVGKVNVETIESGGIAALDSKGKTLYWIGDKTGNDDFFLVGNSITAGAKVESTGDLCKADAACPWMLEFYSGVA
jgi:hypothetical protein